MGISGLFTFIKENNAFTTVDLVKVARDGEITIIVDTHAISKCIVEISLKKFVHDFKNDFLLVPVGEYDIMDRVYYDFHMAFKRANINLVWVVDGPKGVDKESTDQKIITWKEREKDYIKQTDEILKLCDERIKIRNLNKCQPLIDFELGIDQLKEAGAEVILMLRGEADDYIAYLYKKRDAYAVLTNDTDFVIFEDCNVIFEQLISFCYRSDVLNLPFVNMEARGKTFKTPSFLQCPVSSSTVVFNKLKLNNYDQLLVTSILKGNDFTKSHFMRLKHVMGLGKWGNNCIDLVANFVRKNDIKSENLSAVETLGKYLEDNPDFQESLTYSKDFYSLKLVSKNIKNTLIVYRNSKANLTLTSFLAEKLSKGDIHRSCYAIHHGSYFDHICPEVLPADSYCVFDVLGDIRLRIYPYLLDKRQKYVSEWRSRNGEVFKVPVVHSDIQIDRLNGIPDGLKIFEVVWSHKEPGILNYVDRFGLQEALIMYVLRYLYKSTRDTNLHISETEFKALFVTIFYQFSVSQGIILRSAITRQVFLGSGICPTARCVTIVTWFMIMYEQAKYVCGGALDLTEYFPLPITFMNGTTLFAIYEIINGNGDRVQHLVPSLLHKIENLVEEVFQGYASEFAALTVT